MALGIPCNIAIVGRGLTVSLDVLERAVAPVVWKKTGRTEMRGRQRH